MDEFQEQRLLEALERIAAAEERRNELLEADRAERREYFERERAEMASRWQELNLLTPPPEVPGS